MQENQDLLSQLLPGETPWALVTGASGGLGRGIAIGLAKRGWNVALHYFSNRAEAEETAALIRQVGAKKHLILQADLGKAEDVYRMYEELDQAETEISLLVNNAGFESEAAFLDIPIRDWDQSLRVNLNGTFLCSQEAARRMAEGFGGSIINIGSMAARAPLPKQALASTVKAGIHLLTQVMALELGPLGIRVNCIAPGIVRVGRTTAADPDLAGTWEPLTPLRRLGDPVDIADAVGFLASNEAQFINGQVLYVDGGLGGQGPAPH